MHAQYEWTVTWSPTKSCGWFYCLSSFDKIWFLFHCCQVCTNVFVPNIVPVSITLMQLFLSSSNQSCEVIFFKCNIKLIFSPLWRLCSYCRTRHMCDRFKPNFHMWQLFWRDKARQWFPLTCMVPILPLIHSCAFAQDSTTYIYSGWW